MCSKGPKLGILCAGDDELIPFLSLLDPYRITEKAMLKFYEGNFNGVQAVALYSGVCKVNAAVATQILIDSFHCTAVINSGTAGGMDPALELFDTVVAAESAYWDVGEDILTEFHPWLPAPVFPADTGLLALARKVAQEMPQGAPRDSGRVVFGTVATGEAFIDDSNRPQVQARLHPLSVDMETAAAAHVCYVNRIPFLSVRTITDTPSHSGQAAFEENCAKASQIAAKFVFRLAGKLAGKLPAQSRR